MQTDIFLFAIIAIVLGYYAFLWKSYNGLALVIVLSAFAYAFLFGLPFDYSSRPSKRKIQPELPAGIGYEYRTPIAEVQRGYYTPEDY